MDVQEHNREIHKNLEVWSRKPLLRDIYGEFYLRIQALVDRNVPGHIVEVGSGIGNLKSLFDDCLCTDLFPNPWLDVACNGYSLPFRDESVANLVLFDVFHHVRKPRALLNEARRVLKRSGRVIIFEPYISFVSAFVYGWLHHEAVAWRRPIDLGDEPDTSPDYYAAQGNATRLFFRGHYPGCFSEWDTHSLQTFADISYLLSGGFSRPALYPRSWRTALTRLDDALSYFPRFFASRCLICLVKP